jgi:predicted GNAT family acetyltransferase
MKVVQHTDVTTFWRHAGPLYLADPIRHTVAVTVFRGLMTAPDPDAEPPLLLTFEHDGETVGAAFRTPPWPIGVSGVPLDALPELVDWLRNNNVTPPGVAAPSDIAEPFAEAWTAATGSTKDRAMSQRLYRLGELINPGTRGKPRLAGAADVPLLAAWRTAMSEAHGHPQPGEDVVHRLLAIGNAQYLWEVDGEPVAHAASSVPVNGMSRLGPVYTPPEHRNHGYGSAATAAAAQWALDAGAEHVLLFTDLANPTSNSIYQRIGYRPVSDVTMWALTER